MLKLGSLCTGSGMLEAAARMVLDVRPVWVAESDPDAAAVLARRVPVPNLGDIATVDWTAVEPVDVITAGYPCQDLSNAGRRAGIEGAKSGVWRHVADAVRVLRPRVVLLENVAGHLARGFGRVLGDLAEFGYDARWVCVRASDVGAPHQRNRVFIAAADPDRGPVWPQPVHVGAREYPAVAGGHSERPGVSLLPTPTASRAERTQPSRHVAERRYAQGRRMLDDAVSLLPTPTRTNAQGSGYDNRDEPLLPTVVQDADRWAHYAPAIARWEAILGRPAPEPTVVGKRGGRRLSGRFVEWLMGWPDGWVTDLVDNTAALRICGNGVVPQQAAAAYRILLEVNR